MRAALTGLLAFAFVTCAQASDHQALDHEAPRPATVVVAFDRESITPLIVEGVADRATGRKVEANDPVRIASISKMIMAIAALKLADEGGVDLRVGVSKYLGWEVRNPVVSIREVTLKQLLTHRSGLRDNAGYVIPLGDSLQDKLQAPLSWSIATSDDDLFPFAYANLGSPVAASVLEAASGERYDALLDRLVFDPLEIKACANWIGCSDEMIDRAVTLYRDTGEVARDDASDLPPNCTIPVAEGVECSFEDYVPGTNASVFSPQGGIRMGMVDLAKLGQAMVKENSGLLETETLKHMLASSEPPIDGQEFFCGYGYGIQLIEAPQRKCMDDLFKDGVKRYGHAGEAYGLRSGLWFDFMSGKGLSYFITAVPPRAGAEDEGGFDEREIALVARAQALLANGE